MRLGTFVCCLVLVAAWPRVAPAGSLAEIYQLALANDAEFAAAQAAYEAGQEAWPQARAEVLPSVSAFATYSHIKREIKTSPFSGAGGGNLPSAPFTDEFGTTAWGVELRQPLFNWGIPAILSQGSDRVDVATLEFRAARDDLIVRVIQAYIEFLRAQAALELTEAEQRAIAADLERTRGLHEVGAISITALREAQAALDLAEARIISARAGVATASEGLRRITTVWFEDLPAPEDGVALVAPQPEQVDAWVQQAIRFNPEYLAALETADIAEEEIQVEQADYFPDLDLVLAYEDSDQTEFVFGSASNDTRIGLEATWTLFAGGRDASEVQAARALYQRAQAQVEAARRTVVADVRNSYRAVLTAILRVSALEKAVDSAQVALDSVRAEFELGARTKADVLDARRDWYAARIDHVQASYDYLIAAIALKRNAGILAPEDLLALDARLASADAVPASPETE